MMNDEFRGMKKMMISEDWMMWRRWSLPSVRRVNSKNNNIEEGGKFLNLNIDFN